MIKKHQELWHSFGFGHSHTFLFSWIFRACFSINNIFEPSVFKMCNNGNTHRNSLLFKKEPYLVGAISMKWLFVFLFGSNHIITHWEWLITLANLSLLFLFHWQLTSLQNVRDSLFLFTFEVIVKVFIQNTPEYQNNYRKLKKVTQESSFLLLRITSSFKKEGSNC